MRCDRCRSMMFPVELRDGDGGLMNHQAAAWRCFACGEIVDQLICMNRDRAQGHKEDWPKRGARIRIGVASVVR
ncbi:MAG: hypothetical protein K0S58_1882 [Nitrospira sp.]|nr:hypothetical protein [Nitrospira sp.]